MAAGPEAVMSAPARQAPASFGDRAVAAIIDTVISYAGGFALFFLGSLVPDPVTIVFGVGGFAMLFLYAPLMMAITGGQTVGRQVMSIRVIVEDGRRIGLGRALFRELAVKTVFGLLFLPWLISVLWVLKGPEYRALHDYVASTRVVTEPG